VINSTTEKEKKRYLVRCSFIEIYKEEIRDLLGEDTKKKLMIKETTDSGVYVKGAHMFVAKNNDDIGRCLDIGHKNRSQGETLMNAHSSRSHCIFSIFVETQE
jgi:hypothetical protein